MSDLPVYPEAALALWLSNRAADQGDLLFIARTETRLDSLARACAGFCTGRVQLLVLPPWDVLPYDRAAPSAAIVGRRVRTLVRLSEPAGPGRLPRLLIVGADAAMQLVPAPDAWSSAVTSIRVGDTPDLAELRHALGVNGYHVGETVTDRGEVAFRGQVIDLFPADADTPFRLSLDHGVVTAIHEFDPATQRSHAAHDEIEIHPGSEYPLDLKAIALAMEQGEAAAPTPAGALVPIFDYASGFAIAMDEEVPAHWTEFRDQIEEAYDARRKRLRVQEGKRGTLPPPTGLFLTPAAARRFCRKTLPFGVLPAAEPDPRTVGELIRRAQAEPGPVVIAAPGDPARLARSLSKRGLPARAAATWTGAASGGVACCALHVDAGFRTDAALVLQAAPLLRAEIAHGGLLPGVEDSPRAGDVVVHAEHGAARLTGLKPVEVEAMREERLALSFHGGSELLVPTSELDRIWRYGSEGTLDRMDGAVWRAKRQEVEAAIERAAIALAQAAAERAACKAPKYVPDPAAFGRLARRFPHALSFDQAAAVDAVLADLARGRPMDRLICGDVGFGKTEVALRAAAVVAGGGGQVAIVAPTTVLARQHLETFARRFAGTGITVAGLIGESDGSVRAGLADGSVGIVVGTQALAAPGIRFARLGLVVVDEEQRFGEAQKHALSAPGGVPVHTLSMTATPIPRTMQMAMAGLREVSVIATAPQRRQPTRTLVLPFDDALVKDALRREHARGGQSFIVCPRIADMAPMAATLHKLVPRLHLVQAHGRMRAEELEAAVVGFAHGEGDVLLATNIIEAGLDIPRANTILVLHPDRFGLAQLHQIRGRVGRGARRGTAYLLTDTGRQLAKPTIARLRALETLGGLGAGVAISAADLDQRGAGELFGDTQAGHVSVVGTELYHHLLVRAVRAQQGEPERAPAPSLNVGLTGCIPEDYVPETDLRIALYRRLARFTSPAEVDAFEHEIEDRFGPPPPDTASLLALARLRCSGAGAGVRRIESGPRGAAIEVHDAATLDALAKQVGGTARAGRVLLTLSGAPSARIAKLTEAFGG